VKQIRDLNANVINDQKKVVTFRRVYIFKFLSEQSTLQNVIVVAGMFNVWALCLN